MGIYITFVYDLLRIARNVWPHHSFFVAVEDLGFWIYCGGKVFLLMYRESNGSLRWFAVMGALVGMLLYKRSVSKFFVKYVSLFMNRLFAPIKKIGSIPVKKIIQIKNHAVFCRMKRRSMKQLVKKRKNNGQKKSCVSEKTAK